MPTTLSGEVNLATLLASIIGIVRVQTFDASGTYTPHANMVSYIAIGDGSGGGGGGTVVAATAAQAAKGAGGGSGSRAIKFGLRADIGASKAVTIGDAGTGGTAGNNAGTAGGGVVGTGDITSVGRDGDIGTTYTDTTPSRGGDSPIGSGGQAGGGGVSTTGGAATGKAAGGGGGYAPNGTSDAAGGAGTKGRLTIIEICSA